MFWWMCCWINKWIATKVENEAIGVPLKLIAWQLALLVFFCDCFHQQVPYADLHEASECLVKALLIRQRYMSVAGQSFPTVMTRFLHQAAVSQSAAADNTRVINEVPSAGVENGDNSSDSGRRWCSAALIVKFQSANLSMLFHCFADFHVIFSMLLCFLTCIHL